MHRLAHAAGNRAKLHLFQKADQHVRIRVGDGQIFNGHSQRDIAFQCDKIARDADLLGIVDEGLAALGLFDLFGAFQQGFHVAIFID